MATEPELTPVVDFLCEHSPSKSRVMALIGPYHGARSLTAVLTCEDKHHAYQAVQLLRRALASRDTAHGTLPEHRDAYDWDACSDLFFQDHDVLMLFDSRLDGIEDPDGDVNQRLGMGDLRTAAWFEPFGYPDARDPGRGFRRRPQLS